MKFKKVMAHILAGKAKKIMIGSVVIAYLAGSTVPVYAQTFVGSQYPLLYNQLTSQVEQVINFPLQSTSNAESELVDIMNIEQVAIWDDYISNGTSLDFPSTQVQAIQQNLSEKIKQFNKYFSSVASGTSGVIDTSQSSLWKNFLTNTQQISLNTVVANMNSTISQLKSLCGLSATDNFTNLSSQINSISNSANKQAAQVLYKQYMGYVTTYNSLQDIALDENSGGNNNNNMKSVVANLILSNNSTSSLEDLVNNQLPAIVSKIDSKIDGKFKGISSVESLVNNPSQVIQEYYPITKFSYVDVLESTQTVDIIKGITGSQVDSSWEFKTAGMSDLLSKYSSIMAIGKQELADSFGAFTQNNVNESNIYFDKFTSNVKIDGSDTPVRAVNRAYLSCVAASATYIPLESKWANPVYMTALESINKNRDVPASYSAIYNYVKPLYFRAGSFSSSSNTAETRTTDGNYASGTVTYNGSATRLTLADLYKYVQNGTYGELVTGKYKWQPGPTANDDWEFVNNKSTALDVVGYGNQGGQVVTATQAMEAAKNASNSSSKSSTSSSSGSNSNNSNSSSSTTGGITENPTPGGASAAIVIPHNVTLLADVTAPTSNDDKSKDTTVKDNKSANSVATPSKDNSSEVKSTSTTDGSTDNKATSTTDGSTDNKATSTTTSKSAQGSSSQGANNQGNNVKNNGYTIDNNTNAGALQAASTISNPTKLTESFFTFNPWTDKGAMSLFLLGNILNSSAYKKVKNPQTQYLFIDAFGDIVTQDGLVVVPAMANPAYYGNSYNYYVGTAAFLNTYPSITANANGFQVSNSNEVGDTLLAASTNKTTANAELTDLEKFSAFARNLQGMTAYQIDSKTSIADTSIYDEMMSLDTNVVNNDGSISSLMTASIYSNTAGHNVIVKAWKELFDSQNCTLLFQLNSKLSGVIPLQSNNQKGANYLADEAYKSMVVNPQGSVVASNGRFNIVYMTSMFRDALNGSNSTASYVVNCMNGQSTQSEQVFDVINSIGQYLINAEISFLGGAQGVIGVLGPYQNKVFGTILCYVTTYWYFLLLIFMVYFVAMFARRRTNWTIMLFNILLMLVISIASTTIVPLYLPDLYNYVGEPVANKMVYSSIMLQQDKYSPAINTNDIGVNGEYVENSPSITVYTGGLTNTSTMMEKTNLSKFQLFTGNPVEIPTGPGFYIQGNQLQYNIHALLNSYIIHLNTTTNANGISNKPTLELIKSQGSNLDYYCPLSPIMQSFINNLNTFSSAYNMTPSYVAVKQNQMYKSAYLVNAFTNSRLFLQPELFLGGEGTALNITPSYLVLRKYFPNPVDWLGLSSILVPNSPYKNTLWYQQLVRDGYFLPQNRGKLLDVIANVDNQTKQFVMSIQDQIPNVTDSTLVKVISLYATTVLDQNIAEPGHEIYPQSINYQNMTLNQTFKVLMTDPTSKYIGSSDNLSQFILLQYGTLGVWLSTLVLPLAFLIAFLIKWLIPIMYVLLLVVIILRLAFKKEANVAVKGYFKLTSVIWISFFMFSWATCALQTYSGSNIVLFLLLMLYLLIMYLLLNVVFMLFSNLMSMGNDKFDARLSSISDKLKASNFLNKMSVDNLDIANKMKASGFKSRPYREKEIINTSTEEKDEFFYEEDTADYVTKQNLKRGRRRRRKNVDSYNDYDFNDIDS